MMSKEEYKQAIQEEYKVYTEAKKEKLKTDVQKYIPIISTCAVILVVSMILSFLIPMFTLLDFISEITGLVLCIAIAIPAYGIFKAQAYPKNILGYLIETEKFEFNPSVTSKEVFMRNLINYGFSALFVRINEKNYFFEVRLKEQGVNTLENVGDCFINFSEAMDINTFLNCEIDGVKIGEMESFEVLSINFGEPLNFNIK